jgi:hypothetical protein
LPPEKLKKVIIGLVCDHRHDVFSSLQNFSVSSAKHKDTGGIC